MDREEFGRRQAEMTARWMSNVISGQADYAAYIDQRKAAYMDRWREAARFIEDGARVLDIGGGNLWGELLMFFRSRRFDYWYMDVDPNCVAGCKALAATLGFDPSRFDQGFNDELPFPDGAFDAVFSSHCIEHSFDLQKTLDQLWRVIREGGSLLVAIPFGWESNPEHPYFLGPDEWIALIEDAGFEIRVAQIGAEYPESGSDYFIAARRIARNPHGRRLDPADYRKTNFDFIAFDDERISYGREPILAEGHTLCHQADWSISIIPPPGARLVLPIFARHPWSAVVEMRCGQETAVADLFSWFSFVQPGALQLPAGGAGDPVEIRPVGRNPASRGAQCALYGVMVRG